MLWIVQFVWIYIWSHKLCSTVNNPVLLPQKTFSTMGCPRFLLCRPFMYQNFFSGRGERSLVEIKCPVEFYLRWYSWVDAGGSHRFRVWTAWWISWHHKCMMKVGARYARLSIKWSLKIPIALSVVLRWWSWGVTSWNTRELFWENYFSDVEHFFPIWSVELWGRGISICRAI